MHKGLNSTNKMSMEMDFPWMKCKWTLKMQDIMNGKMI